MNITSNRSRWLLISLSLCLAAICWIGATTALSGGTIVFAGKPPTNLGVQSGQLAPCPSTPNCVSSQSQNAQNKIEPLTYNSSPTEAIANLKTVINSLPKTKIITETENYLYAEFTSALMGFVDDVEFYLDESAKIIHVRSASRLGQSDLGVNRKRIETIRAKLNELRS
ncbi:DUF1499 domain-containing protein [Coleofasciculus sp. FACHB-64]|uniref:DUF1499 domain-containing protein n=1 Tax=Cyanophyceae TaxID=3028117 RepID=UPI0016890897|nr:MULTISPECIES: DUF1499 domain-containing protein [unclassified Coleofasciculus]MBD1837626.1 DUF1499 domain-containing protein [Coleofasciculus sp. FACHB-501]MBD1895048.1 DUF1499 domain-containing protein [Coleofasciculus sp. FACHB-129]MBD2048190.1 DUF1499 domain-containing protein [Coleofasciculus sp. FACHB-64]